MNINRKKEAAITENLLVLLLGMFMTMAFTVIIMGAFKSISDRWEMRQLAREYILQMETQGYLTSESQNSLVQELESCGMYDISLDGTTTSEVPYGSRIYLCITGKYDDNILAMAGGISKVASHQTQISIERQSTAKQ